jgi:hypothetical protein
LRVFDNQIGLYSLSAAFGAQPLGCRNGRINLQFGSRQTPKAFGYSCSLKAALLRLSKTLATDRAPSGTLENRPAVPPENSPAFQRWVRKSRCISPGGTADKSLFPMPGAEQFTKRVRLFRPCRDSHVWVRLNPPINGWAIFECSRGKEQRPISLRIVGSQMPIITESEIFAAYEQAFSPLSRRSSNRQAIVALPLPNSNSLSLPAPAGHEASDAAPRGRTTAFGAQPLGCRNGRISLTFGSRQTPKAFGYSCSLKAALLRSAKVCAVARLRMNPFVAISDPV